MGLFGIPGLDVGSVWDPVNKRYVTPSPTPTSPYDLLPAATDTPSPTPWLQPTPIPIGSPTPLPGPIVTTPAIGSPRYPVPWDPNLGIAPPPTYGPGGAATPGVSGVSDWLYQWPVGPGYPLGSGAGGGPGGLQLWSGLFGKAAAARAAANIVPYIGTPTSAFQKATTGGGGGTGAGGPGIQVPEGVDPVWWREFIAEHEGVDPITFYQLDYSQDPDNPISPTTALDMALTDLQWGIQFQADTGAAPTADDWRSWWFHKQGMMTPEEFERYKKRLEKERKRAKEEMGEAWRPPNVEPPLVWWDL